MLYEIQGNTFSCTKFHITLNVYFNYRREKTMGILSILGIVLIVLVVIAIL